MAPLVGLVVHRKNGRPGARGEGLRVNLLTGTSKESKQK